jgi:hypothetical protein
MAYNLAWIASTRSLMALSCTVERGVVETDARAAEKEGDWLRAAHLYHYLSEYPKNGAACMHLDEYDSDPLLPFMALTLRAMHPNFPDGAGANHKILMERSYARTLELALARAPAARVVLNRRATGGD